MTVAYSTPESSKLDAVAVFCASTLGNHPAYESAAVSLAKALVAHAHPVVYGGGTTGLMGVIARTTLKHGGSVTGIVPYAIALVASEQELRDAAVKAKQNNQLEFQLSPRNELVIVNSVHDRKVEISKRVGGFVSLPGGFGTYEEILEIASWTQIGVHTKPVVLLNVLSFYTPLKALISNGIEQAFIQEHFRDLIVFVDEPEDGDWGKAALDALEGWSERNDKGGAPPMFDWSLGLGKTEQVVV